MNQEEIHRLTNEIIWNYCEGDHNLVFKLCMSIHKILVTCGVKLDIPMYATARLMVARDVLRVWEGD